MEISRRGFMFGLPLFVAGCSTSSDYANYAAKPEERHPLAAMPLDRVKPELRRQKVAYSGGESAGTIVVNTPERRLYYVQGDGRAIRYGIGVGKAGLTISGNATVGRKAEWPGWTPTQNMMRRDPRNLRYAGGVSGGLHNPLGARALYLYRGGRDTYFRLHGTIEPETIGSAVSSGCIRLFNQDIIDLYERVPVGATVKVI